MILSYLASTILIYVIDYDIYGLNRTPLRTYILGFGHDPHKMHPYKRFVNLTERIFLRVICQPQKQLRLVTPTSVQDKGVTAFSLSGKDRT